MAGIGAERLSLPFNSAPGDAPAFADPATHPVPAHWNRLITSSWDSQHYIALALRGYEYCAPRVELGPGHLPDDDPGCEVNFFPGYAFVGGWVAFVFRAPVDYALLGVSLACSWLLMFLWTGKEMREALGSGAAWLSLLYLNAFTSAYSLATVQTEPLAMCLAMATFVSIERRWYLLGALAAGACSIVRPTGIATSLAFALALLVMTVRDRPAVQIIWRRAGLMALSGWGLIAFLLFCQIRFGDALVYVHARARYYHCSPSLLSLLHPSYRVIARSIWAGPNEAVWLATALVWFALGHRSAMSGFRLGGKVFWYMLFVTTVGVGAISQVECGFSGMSRYLLLALPLFFAIAAATKDKPLAIAFWLVASLGHYWAVNACYYVSGKIPRLWEKCAIQPAS